MKLGQGYSTSQHPNNNGMTISMTKSTDNSEEKLPQCHFFSSHTEFNSSWKAVM